MSGWFVALHVLSPQVSQNFMRRRPPPFSPSPTGVRFLTIFCLGVWYRKRGKRKERKMKERGLRAKEGERMVKGKEEPGSG